MRDCWCNILKFDGHKFSWYSSNEEGVEVFPFYLFVRALNSLYFAMDVQPDDFEQILHFHKVRGIHVETI